MPMLMQRIDISVASALGPDELRTQIAEIVEEIIVDLRIQLNATELQARSSGCWSTTWSASGRWSRCSPTTASPTSWSTGRTRSTSSARASSS